MTNNKDPWNDKYVSKWSKLLSVDKYIPPKKKKKKKKQVIKKKFTTTNKNSKKKINIHIEYSEGTNERT